MEKLNPCPFCGSVNIDFDTSYDNFNPRHFAFCDNCGAQGGDSLDVEGAAENWNKRALLTDE